MIGILVDGQACERLDEINHENPVTILLDKTPFYGEMGGQVGDIGELMGEHFRFEVVDAQAQRGFVLHRGHLRQGKLVLGEMVNARVDAARGKAIRRAHSATHLLHAALQKHLGRHAQQQGSKVDNDLLLDFANPRAVAGRSFSRSRTR